MRGPWAAVCLLVLIVGCGKAPTSPITSGTGYKLYEATTQHADVAVIDTASHSTERTLPLGTPSQDWKHIYSIKGQMLVDTDPATGATLRTLRLPGDYQLPPATLSGLPGGLSPNGQWLGLERLDRNGGVVSATHLLVVETSYVSPPIRIDLQGNFSFDAISNDGQRLYLIEFVSSASYRVRMYDVFAGQMDPTIVFDKTNGNEAMAGLRLAGVASPDGAWLFSLYVRENEGPFIHALSLGGPLAFCIDLPGTGYAKSGDAFHWSIAMSPDGRRLYAANSANGMLSVLDTSNFGPKLLQSVHVNTIGTTASGFAQNVEAKMLGANGAVVSPDGQTLVTNSTTGITWIDTTTLKARSYALPGWTIWSLALSPDGKILYALSDSGKVAEVSMSGRSVQATFDPAAGQPLALIRVEAPTP